MRSRLLSNGFKNTVIAAAAWGLGGTCAVAQPAPPGATQPPSADRARVEDIVVTAQKKSEKLQQVPVTVSAFDAATLKRQGITQTSDLSTVVPGLVYTEVVGYAVPYLRGIGTTATGPGFENPVATYVDGVYYGTQAGDLLSLNNVAGVEVDKGPQGTLFGRNSTGGAIQIRTLDPSDVFGGSAEAGYGNYNTYMGRFYVTGALAPNLSANLAVNEMLQDKGYGRNLANGDPLDRSSDVSARSKFVYTPDADTKINLTLDYDRSTEIPALYPAPGTIPQFDPPIAPNPRDAYGSPQPFGHTTQDGFGLTVKHDFDFATFTSITAARETMFNSLFDSTLTAVPGTTFFVGGKEPHTQVSQEFQLTSPRGRVFEWTVGAYYYWERAGYNEPTAIGGSSFTTFGLPGGLLQAPDSVIDSGAIYAQGTYHITPATDLELGLRYTDEYKIFRFTQTIPAFDLVEVASSDKNYSIPTWRVALKQTFSPDVMGYVSYDRGVKSGGFTYNPLIPTFGLQQIRPERLDALEAGVKSEFFEHRVKLNGAFFYYFYNNIQTAIYPDGSETIINAPAARLYGLDLDGEVVLTPDLHLSGGLEALHGTYSNFPNYFVSSPVPYAQGGGTVYASTPTNIDGYHLPKTPPLTATVAADYVHIFSFAKLAANATYSYDAGWYAEPDNRLKQSPYRVLNLSLSLGTANDRTVLKIWGKNMLNDLYAVFLASQTNGDEVQWAPPRTFGFTVAQKF